VSPPRLAARAVELLGRAEGPVAIACPRAPRLAAALAARLRPAGDGDRPAAAVIAFVGAASGPAERQRLLRALHTRLPPGAPVVLVDHSQPRAWWRRVPAVVLLLLRRLSPRRARYPAARELAALGFAVEALRLAAGERMQLVLARR
jgi:hypothetical protein